MAVRQKYDVIDLEKGTLDNNIFTSGEVYQDEMERVFGRAWLMISHESLIPNPNDFFLSYMGEDPVIVTRDSKGQVHTFLNMCRHRGNRIVRADDGNAKNVMCAYHGWTFSNQGELVSVPGLQEAYYGELDVENLGLVEARVDVYAGMIFATWSEDAPSLEAFLGDARWYLDTRFNYRDCGMQALGPMKWIEPVNWKTPVDNSSDNYHAQTTHISVGLARRVVKDPSEGPAVAPRSPFDNTGKHLFVNGHSMTLRMLQNGVTRPFRGRTPENASAYVNFHKQTLPEVERRLGKYRAHAFYVGNHTIFPNSVLELRMALPRGPQRTEFWSFATYEKDAPDEIVRTQRTGHMGGIGISGLNEQDDLDNWIQVSQSGLSPIRRRYRHQLSMGIGHNDPLSEHKGGMVSERFFSESNQRNLYSRWQEFMNADSWKDIHIDPITATFEGTATMKG